MSSSINLSPFFHRLFCHVLCLQELYHHSRFVSSRVPQFIYILCHFSLHSTRFVIVLNQKRGADMGEFHNVFKSLRQAQGYSQTDLADALDISRSSISMYENGNREPDFETLEKIADFFHVDTDYLLGRKKTAVVNSKKEPYEPTYEDIQSLIARNGKALTLEQKRDIIRTLLSDD